MLQIPRHIAYQASIAPQPDWYPRVFFSPIDQPAMARRYTIRPPLWRQTGRLRLFHHLLHSTLSSLPVLSIPRAYRGSFIPHTSWPKEPSTSVLKKLNRPRNPGTKLPEGVMGWLKISFPKVRQQAIVWSWKSGRIWLTMGDNLFHVLKIGCTPPETLRGTPAMVYRLWRAVAGSPERSVWRAEVKSWTAPQ